MSIRSARAEDHWRRAFSRTYTTRYTRLEFANLVCLGRGEIVFRGGMTAIVGGNGVGKSTLAAALGEVLRSSALDRLLGNEVRLRGSSLDGEIFENDTVKHRRTTAVPGGLRDRTGDDLVVESWWLDPGFWAFHTRGQVVKDQNFDDLIESLTPIKLDQGEIESISYIVGKDYEQCLIYEILDYADFDRFPYFRVRANGIEYGSESMGQGELSLLIVFWVLRDLRPSSILILEEPESHVSPRAQTALMNVVARACDEKGLWVIITTHSPTVVSRLPLEHVRLLVRDDQQVLIFEKPRRHQLAAILGGAGGFRGVLLVEDKAAMETAIALLDELSPDLLRQFEVVAAGSSAEVSAALTAFPKTQKWLHVIGLYDGDQRGRVAENDLKWPVAYLPGNTGPEELLKSALNDQGAIGDFAAELRRDRADVLMTLDALTGREPHDWLIECGRNLNVQRSELVRALVKVWLKSEPGHTLGAEFVQGLEARYDK